MTAQDAAIYVASIFHILNYRRCVSLKKLPPPQDTLNLKLYQCLQNYFKYGEKQNSKTLGSAPRS